MHIFVSILMNICYLSILNNLECGLTQMASAFASGIDMSTLTCSLNMGGIPSNDKYIDLSIIDDTVCLLNDYGLVSCIPLGSKLIPC